MKKNDQFRDKLALTYRVTKLTPNWQRGEFWEWKVTAYRAGEVVLETVHKTDWSKDMEVDTWKERGAKEIK